MATGSSPNEKVGIVPGEGPWNEMADLMALMIKKFISTPFMKEIHLMLKAFNTISLFKM